MRARNIASFVTLLGDGGETRGVAMLDGPAVVALQSLAVEADGTILVAGALGDARGRETHLFAAALRE